MADAGADDAELERYLEDPRFHRAWERFGQSADDDIREAVSSLASATVDGTKVAWDKKFRSAIDAGETKYDDKPYDGSPFIRIREIAYWIFTKTFDLKPEKASELATELEHHAVISAGLDWGKHQTGSRMPEAGPAWEPITRDAFGYLGGDRGSKQCGDCYQFAKEKERCAILGPDFEVDADDTCIMYLKGEYAGQPIRKLATPEEVGFMDGEVQCQRCRYGGPKCQLYIALNEAMPDDFRLEEAIEPAACCNSWKAKVSSGQSKPSEALQSISQQNAPKLSPAQQAKSDGNEPDRSPQENSTDGRRPAGERRTEDGK